MRLGAERCHQDGGGVSWEMFFLLGWNDHEEQTTTDILRGRAKQFVSTELFCKQHRFPRNANQKIRNFTLDGMRFTFSWLAGIKGQTSPPPEAMWGTPEKPVAALRPTERIGR